MTDQQQERQRLGCEFCDGMCLGRTYVHVCAAALRRCALDSRKVVVTRAAHALAVEGQKPGERRDRLDYVLSRAVAALGDDPNGRAFFRAMPKADDGSYSGPFELAVDARWPLVTIATPEEDTTQCQFSPELALTVLFVSDLEASKGFYELVGLYFRREQHGSEPAHYSARMGPAVVELYPRGDRSATRTRLGLRTDRLPDIVEKLRVAGFAVEEVEGVRAFSRAVATDPDGNKVELYGR